MRLPRIKITDRDAWYHLISRVAGSRHWLPLHEPAFREVFLQVLHKYVSAFFFDLATYTLMGNHYHLVGRCQRYRKLNREQLQRRAEMIYRRKCDWPHTKKQWQRFNKRLFDVSEMMRSINQALARWYNDTHDRVGPLFAERFASVLQSDLATVLNTMIYVDLNAVRAGLVKRPEQWRWGGLYDREQGGGEVELVSLREILAGSPDAEGEYWFRLYWRGGMDGKENGMVIPARIVESELGRGFKGGEYLKVQSSLSRGVIAGSFQSVSAWIARLRKLGYYRRERKPVAQQAEGIYTLRAPRPRRPLKTASQPSGAG